MTMDFSERLQALRREKGLSQEELADALGVSRQAVSKWESGQSYPEMDKLIAMCELFNVTLDTLVRGTRDDAPSHAPTREDAWNGPVYFRNYEYKSKRSLFGLPLVHINVGFGMRRAKGIIAIGNLASGVVSIGILSMGILSIGALSLGVASFAALSLGLLFSAGGIAVGTVAIGGVAVGVVTLGGLSVGVYSVGGCAVASDIAVGGYARGHVAIGDIVSGARTIVTPHNHILDVPKEQVREMISEEYPGLWKPIADWIVGFFR